MQYCPYTTGDSRHQLYRDAVEIIQSNDKNGKSIPQRVFSYIENLSDTTQVDYLDQWKIDREIELPEENKYYCTCGHEVHYLYLMINTTTDKMLISGSDCIHKFSNKRLNSEVNRSRLKRQLKENISLPISVKYVKKTDGYQIKYMFKLRSGTNLYKVLEEYDSGDHYVPWFFGHNDHCYINVNHKYAKIYERDKWYNINISMREYNNNIAFHYRAST